MSDVDALSRVEKKLDILIRLLALEVASHDSSLAERARRLQLAGLSPKETAALCETTPNTVSVALSAAKRNGKKAKKSKAAK